MKPDIYIAQKIINLLNKYKLFREPHLKDNIDYKWQRLFSNNAQKYLHTLTDNLRIYLYKDSVLSKLIFEGFEKDEEMFINRHLSPGDVVFDIGANVGIHTLIAAAALGSSGHVYSFEPTPTTFDRLTENIMLNKLGATVSIYQAGLSDKTGTLTLNIAGGGQDAWNSFAQNKRDTASSNVQVKVITFDDFVAENKIEIQKIALIKIDVEGWEVNVLSGMAKLFERANFDADFLIEFTEENMFNAGSCCTELYNFMADKGYKWYSYNAETNQLTHSPLKTYYPYENLIATKNIEKLNARINK